MLLWRGGGNFDLISRSRIDLGRRCATSGGSEKLSFRSGSLSIIARKCFPTILDTDGSLGWKVTANTGLGVFLVLTTFFKASVRDIVRAFFMTAAMRPC